MSEIVSHHKLKMGSERNFGLVFFIVFTVIAFFPVFFAGTVRWWALVIAFVFGGLAMIAPGVLSPLNRIWFLLGVGIGKVISPMVMMIVFFLAVTPVALLARILGKDFLWLSNRHSEKKSYWSRRDENPDQPTSMKNQF